MKIELAGIAFTAAFVASALAQEAATTNKMLGVATRLLQFASTEHKLEIIYQ